MVTRDILSTVLCKLIQALHCKEEHSFCEFLQEDSLNLVSTPHLAGKYEEALFLSCYRCEEHVLEKWQLKK